MCIRDRYLCAVFDDTDKENPVIARSNAIGTWEKFYAEKQSDGTYALKTYVDNYYVQADIDDATSGILHAYGCLLYTSYLKLMKSQWIIQKSICQTK